MTVNLSDLHAFPSQESYELTVDGETVGLVLQAFDDVIEVGWSGGKPSPVQPGGEYPRDPGLEGLHRLGTGTTVEDFASKHSVELRRRSWTRNGQAVAAYGLSPEEAEIAWVSLAERNGLELLHDQELVVEELDLNDGFRRSTVWRAAGHAQGKR